MKYTKTDVEALLNKIDDLYEEIERLNDKNQKMFIQLTREQQLRQSHEIKLNKMEARFTTQQKQQMSLMTKQLREQEEFVLSIKLNLASLNKSYQEKQTELIREKGKQTVLRNENRNLAIALNKIKSVLDETHEEMLQRDQIIIKLRDEIEEASIAEQTTKQATMSLDEQLTFLRKQVDELKKQRQEDQSAIIELER